MRILLLGTYGNFASLIARELAGDAGLELVLAGRNLAAAQAQAESLRGVAGRLFECAAIDVAQPGLATLLIKLKIDLVIHSCGPFQRQHYTVAHAALDAGTHYLDLADARDFVCGISALDAAARARGRLVVAGASTVPGLSAAVVDRYQDEFSELRAIDMGISPGNRAPRGLATVASILSYVGQPVQMWINGQWRRVIGWQDLRRQIFPPPAGARWLGNCDIADLTLFPARYAGLRSMRFGAGLELGGLHLGLWVLSWLVRWRLLARLDRWAPALRRMSEWFLASGTDIGVMHVCLRGTAKDGSALTLTWTLIAGSGHGPQIPATAAVVIARKLARDDLAKVGAMPCLGLFSLEEFLAALEGRDIRTHVQRDCGPSVRA